MYKYQNSWKLTESAYCWALEMSDVLLLPKPFLNSLLGCCWDNSPQRKSKDSFRDCQASLCFTWKATLNSVIVTTGNDTGKTEQPWTVRPGTQVGSWSQMTHVSPKALRTTVLIISLKTQRATTCGSGKIYALGFLQDRCLFTMATSSSVKLGPGSRIPSQPKISIIGNKFHQNRPGGWGKYVSLRFLTVN